MEHLGTDQIVGDEASKPFFFEHVRRLAFELFHCQLGVEVTKVQFDLPAHAIEFDQLGQRKGGCIGESGKKKENAAGLSGTVKMDGNQTALDGVFGSKGAFFVGSGRGPLNRKIRPLAGLVTQQFLRSEAAESQQDVTVGLASGLDHSMDAKITIPQEERWGFGQADDLTGQDLFSDSAGADLAGDDKACAQAKGTDR